MVYIDECTEPSWRALASSHSGLREIVIPGWFARVSRLDSQNPVEHSGYLVGVIEGHSFYVIANHRLDVGKGQRIDGREVRGVMLDVRRSHYWTFEEEVVQRFSNLNENVRTIIWHSHPRTTLADLKRMCEVEASAIESVLREEVTEGGFDYLACNGCVDVDEVINEVVSRKLSDADIQNTPGMYHLLLTNTFRSFSILSHINAYRIRKDLQAVETVSVNPLFKKPMKYRLRYRELSEQYHQAFLAASQRHESLVEQLPLELCLDPRKIPNEYLFLKE